MFQGFGQYHSVAIHRQWHKVDCKVRLILNGNLNGVRGDRLEIIGWIKPVANKKNPAERSRYFFWRGQGIFYTLIATIKHTKFIGGRQGCPILNFFSDLRQSCCERLLNLTGSEAGSVAIALFLGEKHFLTKDTIQKFQYTGIMHEMTVSGFNVSVLAGIIYCVLRWCCLPYFLNSGLNQSV